MALTLKVAILLAVFCSIAAVKADFDQENQDEKVNLFSVDEVPLQDAESVADVSHVRNKRFFLHKFFKPPTISIRYRGFGGFGRFYSHGYHYPSYSYRFPSFNYPVYNYRFSGSGGFFPQLGGRFVQSSSSSESGGGGGGVGHESFGSTGPDSHPVVTGSDPPVHTGDTGPPIGANDHHSVGGDVGHVGGGDAGHVGN